jgi:hypothetical protein
MARRIRAAAEALPSIPIQETDYHRYLWNGRVTARGLNPHRFDLDDTKIRKRGADSNLQTLPAFDRSDGSFCNSRPTTSGRFCARYETDRLLAGQNLWSDRRSLLRGGSAKRGEFDKIGIDKRRYLWPESDCAFPIKL